MYTYCIQKAANSFVKEHGITAKSINSFEFISAIAEKESYNVYRFEDENDNVVQALNAGDFCRANIAFTIHHGDVRCIFIKSDVPDKAAAKLLLHELAHIRLHHLDKCETTASANENDTDVFVNYVLSKVCRNVKQASNKSMIFILCLIVIMTCCALYSGDANDSENPEYFIIEPIVVDSTPVTFKNPDTVYVTNTGDKYHKQDCFHLKNRHVTALSIDTAESLGKEPCMDCYD